MIRYGDTACCIQQSAGDVFVRPQPQYVADVERPVISLNDGTGQGIWKFLMGEGENSSWEPVKVPGELAMQGFDIENNTEYYYRRSVEIPADYKDKIITLQFDGVYSDARVWVGRQLIAGHSGGFTSWSCEITDYVVPGEAFTLTVGVADLEGTHEGIYNPDGGHKRNPAWASYYAHHNIGGILRDVSLVAFSKEHILHTSVNSTFSKDYKEAAVELHCVVRSEEEPTGLYAVLYDREGMSGELQLSLSDENMRDCPRGSDSRHYQGILMLSDPHLWDAEHPYLYTMELRLEVNGTTVQKHAERLGLREILYGGRNGTDRNQIYVNGKPIKLRGVCRHDISWDMGRSITKEQAYREIQGYKECNINFIRTSHYPASKYTLDACDELGIYVEQETAACFQGDNGFDIYCEPEEFLHQFQEMVYADRNRACILIWSLGNESGFEKSEGFRLCYDFIKKTDLSRPVIFSYPYTVRSYPAPYDILSRHYEDITANLGHVEIPVLHDEFAHIACYNMEELKRDPNVRNFWGEGLKMAWENIMETEGALGCALWGAIDDIFYLPNQVSERMQNHSNGRAAGYGEWGCIYDVFMRYKPEAFFVKKAFSPIQVKEEAFVIYQNQLILPVKNRFDHTNLKELMVEYVVDGKSVQRCYMPDVAEHTAGVLVLEGDWTHAETVQVFFYHGEQELIDDCMLVLKETKKHARIGGGECPQMEENETVLLVTGQDFSVKVSRVTGQIVCGEYKGCPILNGGPYLHTSELYRKEFVEHSVHVNGYAETDCIAIEIMGEYEDHLLVQFRMCIYGDGKIVTSYVILDAPNTSLCLSEIGISYELAADTESVTWERKGLYQHYPENHLGRTKGIAYKNGGVFHGYGEYPTCEWKDDRSNYFLYADDDKNHGTAANDFKAMRENIWNYEVTFQGTGLGLRVEANADRAVRLHYELPDRTRLIINNQWSYQDLGWGNRNGRPGRYSKGAIGDAVVQLVDRR